MTGGYEQCCDFPALHINDCAVSWRMADLPGEFGSGQSLPQEPSSERKDAIFQFQIGGAALAAVEGVMLECASTAAQVI